jgi:phenylalanyl-tRNA synthetase beta chain
MKVTLNWLKQYVDFNWSPEELAERLTMLGVEVEAVEKKGAQYEGIVVAQILASEKHPNADKLSVCRVTHGQGERQIVCGAKNYKVGDKVPLILPGQTLPARTGEEPVTIKAGKIRGIESHGMLCSPKELGLTDDADGLLILPPDATIGQSFAEHLGHPPGDVMFDLEITPNRPDLNSVIGIAREISALTANPLRIPQVDLQETTGNQDENGSGISAVELVDVRLDDPELCPRYVARLVRGVRIGPSPDWLRSILEKVGIRSINNVVDVTNYVMMESGQPLHAFDYRLLSTAPGASKPAIVVRRASEGEKFTTLDGQEHTLTNRMLLIADETKPVALAGVMGGQNSEINPQTVDVLIESACFKPQNIRATSKALDLRTESSYRFERGADIENTDWSSRRAAQLILATAQGNLARGAVDAYPTPFEAPEVTLRHDKVRELLGTEIPVRQQIDFLSRLELKLSGPEHGAFNTFRIPAFRVDLKREIDLVEEITRLYGVDKIPASAPRGAIGANSYDATHDELAEARRILAGLGLFEAQGQTLISEETVELVKGHSSHSPVRLENPLSSDMNVLRPNLLIGLLDSIRHNVNHKNNDIALFEIGRVFSRRENRTVEERHLAIAITGQRHASFWHGQDRDAKYDIFDLKGLIDEFFDQLGVRGLSYARREEHTSLLVESAVITLGKYTLGEIGQLLPPLARRYDQREPVLLAELNLDTVLARRNPAKSFKPLPAFPSVRRDVAMLLPEQATHEAVLQAVRKSRPANLETVELFDVYRGQNVPAGQKSVAYAFTYRSPERTLTDAEVNATHEKLVEEFRRTLQAAIRE